MLFDFNSVSPEMRAVLEPVVCRHAQEHLPEDCPASLQFVQMPGISPECCVVTGYGSQMTLAASDTLGFLCGLGKCLRRIASGEPMQRTLRFTPQKKLRGVYFATHFGNWYVSAPEEEVERYIEDLALWGMNTLAVWYDIHAFSGVDDPGAAALRDRLHMIFRVCRRLGVRTLLGMLANEAFSTSDPTLRADWCGNQNGYTSAPQGHYHVEYCPSVPGGMRAILETKAAVLGEFRDCPPDAVWLWPYDQGGCTCARCAPWGGKGYVDTLRAVAPFVKAALPGCKVLASSWYFGQFTGPEEWQRFLARTDEVAQCCDGLIAEFPFDLEFPDFLKSYPLPVYGFEELSMRGACPWGGFGANPMPDYVSKLGEKLLRFQQGGFVYSEGIFEDLNKCLMLSLFCDPEQDVNTALREYARYELGMDGDAAVWLLHSLEETLPRETRQGVDGRVRFILAHPENAKEIAGRMDLLYADTPPRFRSAFRFRQLYLRTQIDRELARNNFLPNHELQLLYRQLTAMYHAENADWVVSPPTEEALARM